MKIFIIICMIISLLITPWAPVYGAAGAIMGVTGAVAALMQAYGYVTSVTGDTYDAQDVSAGIGDMMEAYSAHLGTTVAALFPASSILFTAGSTVLKYSSDIVDAVQGMISYFSQDGAMNHTIDSQSEIMFGPGLAYKLPITWKTEYGYTITTTYTGNTSSEYIYAAFITNPYGGGALEVFDFSGSSSGSLKHTWSNTDGTSGVAESWFYKRSDGTHTYFSSFNGQYGRPNSGQYMWTSSLSPSGVLAPYYYGDEVTEDVSSIVITGSDALPDTAEDTSLMIPGIGTAGTLDTAGEQILDLVVEGALDIVTQLPDGDPISPDLFDVFPFCLPYDMYRLLHVFDAEPQAPVIHWPIKVDSIGVDEELVVDLSEWDSVAALLRHLETIVFLVGLALITRKWIGAE